MTNSITPCNTFVRPVANEIAFTNKANINNTVDFISIPSVIVQPVTKEKIAIAAIVKPMVANAEPKAKLRLV